MSSQARRTLASLGILALALAFDGYGWVVRCGCGPMCHCGAACRCPRFWSPWIGVVILIATFTLAYVVRRLRRCTPRDRTVGASN
jgi:hypothetical protein